ncbi:Hypp8985 [Branchiostoma lanceolatum]|uniref:Hypp8985 protein n=1 Tax=Branchiostoma lanceolatum TaxID=7740 RepID=A0A8J9ZBT1_BRALA|nr:Hypp8985 [Branchiostoma lanceolatum]
MKLAVAFLAVFVFMLCVQDNQAMFLPQKEASVFLQGKQVRGLPEECREGGGYVTYEEFEEVSEIAGHGAVTAPCTVGPIISG